MGNSNNSLNVIESNCDLKHSDLRIDSGVVTDKEKLPILGISYGRFLQGSAKIIIGPLTCSSG